MVGMSSLLITFEQSVIMLLTCQLPRFIYFIYYVPRSVNVMHAMIEMNEFVKASNNIKYPTEW